MSITSTFASKISKLESRAVTATTLDAESLGVSRIMFGLFFFLFQWDHYRWIGEVPKSFFCPPPLSLASLFSTFPSETFFVTMDWIIFVAAACTTIGLLACVHVQGDLVRNGVFGWWTEAGAGRNEYAFLICSLCLWIGGITCLAIELIRFKPPSS